VLLKAPLRRRMHAAVAGSPQTIFITPMAAVAGSVAEEVLGAMVGAAQLERFTSQWRRHRAVPCGRRAVHT